ncbi:membrane-bound neuregulin protein vein isoform X2 [Rhodnius prolixus]|uniref:membrane-bound neuregulin protein vein isoform X2 n=1 Tax=Rhodnius prolixus TaxID=13249 RepID=UPI003D18D785
MRVGGESCCMRRLLFLVTVGAAVTAATSPGFSRTAFSGHLKSDPSLAHCSHIGDSTNSVAARAYMAGTVFEGKARSRSVPREIGGVYGVTFVVQHVHKDKGVIPLKIKTQVRLKFREKRGARRQQQEQLQQHNFCRQSYNYTRRDLVRTSIKRGGKYIVFVMGIGPHNYTLLGEPVFRSRKNVQAVRDALCHNCFRMANVTGLKDTKVKVNGKLRLVCRCKGNPLPALSWYKDGKPINATQHSKIKFKKKRSSLYIPKVSSEDAGRYECRGMTVTGKRLSSWATVTVTDPLTDNTTTLWPLSGVACPIEQYCLNNGNCTYYEAIGELVCQCAEGFKGQRCDTKDVYNRSKSVLFSMNGFQE